jgi:uncharacterized protein
MDSSVISSTTIRTISDVDRIQKNDAVLIAGFPGTGLVGSISTSYIINKLNMHQIACVESEFISPGVIFIDGKLRHPFRLYSNEKGNVCVLVCEAPIMINGIHSVLDSVMNWVIKNSIREVLVLDGVPMQGIPRSNRSTMILGSNETHTNTIINKTKEDNMNSAGGKKDKYQSFIQKVMESADKNHTTFIGGIAGGLLSSCLSYQIPCAAILVASTSGIPDPEGAALLIESYNKIIQDKSLMIDVTQLKEQGQILKNQLEQIIRSEQEQRDQATTTSTEQRIMYG